MPCMNFAWRREATTARKLNIDRLEQVFQQLGLPVRGKKCEGMQHLIAEGDDMISEPEDDAARDAVMIAGGAAKNREGARG
jgi:ferritin-like metal-binding protein YciE